MPRATFPKTERLCSRKLTEQLFEPGNRSVTAFPLRAVARKVSHDADCRPVQVMVTVSKRHFKHAVDRNRAKRQMREAWRLNREVLFNSLPAQTGMHIAFVWLSDKPCPSHIVARKMRSILQRLSENLGDEQPESQPLQPGENS